MTAAENVDRDGHLDHFARGYRLRPSGNTPALTNSRMVNNRRTWSKRSPATGALRPQPVRTRLAYSVTPMTTNSRQLAPVSPKLSQLSDRCILKRPPDYSPAFAGFGWPALRGRF